MRRLFRQIKIKRSTLVCFAIIIFAFAGCATDGEPRDERSTNVLTEMTSSETTVAHHTVSAEEAKSMMESAENYIIVDVRTQDEFDSGYIEGAILIPHAQMRDKAPDMLSDKNQMILIYCRSGRRSAYAAEVLTSMGYTQVYDFGGIIDWPYETIRDDK